MLNFNAVLIVAIIFVQTAKIQSFEPEERSRKALTDDDRNMFKKWKETFNKTYASEKIEENAEINFIENLSNIKNHNKRTNESYTRGIAVDTDMSFDEKKINRTGIKFPKNRQKPKITINQILKNVTAPFAVNHTSFFPPVKDQGGCASCWAFAATSVIEYWTKRSKKLITCSEQNLIDCDTASSGCQGGWPSNAFNYIRDQGISDGTKYRFKSFNQKCQRTTKNFLPILKIPNSCEIDLEGNEENLRKLIAQYGPVVITIAITDGFTSYKNGIFYDPACTKNADHAVSLVGYGSNKRNGDFWIIRNSWGKSWGMQGYGLVARNRKNHCGVASFAMFPC